MAEANGANMSDRLATSGPLKKAARAAGSAKPRRREAWNRWSAGFVVRDVRGVPELLVPGQEDLGPQFPQHARAGERASELVDVLAESAGADSVPSPQVEHGS